MSDDAVARPLDIRVSRPPDEGTAATDKPMTIIFTGHVAQVVLSGINLDVHIQTAAEACGQTIVVHVPRSAANHWLPGRAVSLTMYAFDPPQTANAGIERVEARKTYERSMCPHEHAVNDWRLHPLTPNAQVTGGPLAARPVD